MKRDFDTDEKEFLGEISESLAGLQTSAGPCPHPDLVMSAAAGVQGESTELILKHLQDCSLCQHLTRDLSEYEYPALTKEEDRRIRARWENRNASERQAWWGWFGQPYALGALAAILLVAVLFVSLWRGMSGESGPTNTAQTNPAPEPPAPVQPEKVRTAFVLSKAAIKVPAAAVLTFRNDAEDAKAFLNEFASALKPYRSDDFAEAARLLGPLAEEYRESAEVHYYLGISRLFLKQDSAALESLQTARLLADENLRDDVAWYLAIAFDRAGRIDDARREIGTLCSRAGEYQKQACASQEEVGKP